MKKNLVPVFILFFAVAFSVSAEMSDADFFKLCSKGTLDDVKNAVAGGANVNAWGEIKDGDGFVNYYTCLMIACRNEKVDIAEFLLERGSQPNTHSREYPIHFVVGWKDSDVQKTRSFITKLISRGAEIDARTNTGLTPLLITASDPEKEDIALLLIELGADVNVRDSAANTPLILALSSGVKRNLAHRLLAQLVVKSGADTNAKNMLGETAVAVLKKYDNRKIGEAKYYSWYWKIMDNYYNSSSN